MDSKKLSLEGGHFVRALLSRAEEDACRIRDGATEEARTTLGEARLKVEALREERLFEARRRAERKLSRQMSEARFQTAAERTRLVDDAVSRTFREARRALGELRASPEYATVFGRLLEECLAELPAETRVKLVIDPRDQATLERELVHRDLPIASDARGGPFLGGLKAGDEAGRFEIDNTFEARLDARASEIRVRLGKIFLGQ